MLDWSDSPKKPLAVNGVTLDYACHGPAPDQAPTIVMLHEGLGCVALWRDFPEQVAKATGFGVFVYSRQGYGQSDPVDLPRPLDFMTREAVDVLPHVLDQMGFEQGILFGHSDGATIAAIYAGGVVDHRVRGLILMAPHFFTEESGLEAINAAKGVFESGYLSDRMAKYHRDPDGAFRGWADTWLDPGFRDWHVGEAIDYFRIPTLAIQGRDDQYGTLAQISEIEERSYAPVDTVILDNCQHAPHQEQPGKTLAAVVEFAARLKRIEEEQVEIA
ncbi:alpha/beta fold hydrolase [Thalassococcus sp. S3]|uniref:alpha/beta fold hydrolase n=1 Tax=Thalassococcus sp. S3 TaxID=2017482 RepID=UPI00102492A2|nr:alpha/beta hydrolase [Thalassococcus sp. S3]QBF33868.1 alpha/beta hydrolase [Thalassococcus sp. S3]